MALKSLQTLIKLHKRRIDLFRREVLQLEEERKQLQILTKTLQDEYKQELHKISEDPRFGRFFVDYSKHTKERLESIASEIVRISGQIDTKTELIREEYSEQKKFEILLSKKELEIEQKIAKQSGQFLDEIGIQQFLRSEDNST